MKDSSFWAIAAIVLVGIATTMLIGRDYLPSDPMYVEMIATLFGVLIAITFGEFLLNTREERKTKSVEKDLIGELRDIQNKSSQDPFTERYSPTWTAIKAKGIPDRIEPKLRKALSEALVLFDDHNNKLRRYDDLRLTGDPEDRRLSDLRYHARTSSEKFVESAQRVIDMVDS